MLTCRDARGRFFLLRAGQMKNFSGWGGAGRGRQQNPRGGVTVKLQGIFGVGRGGAGRF